MNCDRNVKYLVDRQIIILAELLLAQNSGRFKLLSHYQRREYTDIMMLYFALLISQRSNMSAFCYDATIYRVPNVS